MKIACVLTVSMASAVSAWAQSATAKFHPNPIRIDAYARYSIRIEDGTPAEQPLLKLPPEVQVVPGSVGTQREISIINGQQKDFITFIWTLTVDREGEFLIPPQEVTLTGDKKIQTNEVTIKVDNQATADDQRLVPTLTLEVGKVKFYEGEQVPITARLTTHRQSQIRRFHLIEMPKQDFAMQRFPLQAQDSLSNIGGEQYIVRDYTTQMNALKPGTFDLGPATMDVVYEVPDPAYAASGARALFVPTQTQSTKATSNTVRVEVLPLPKENRPESFKGAIGRFRLRAQATPTSVKVGEPISVDIEVTGAGNFDALNAPELSNAKGWRVYPSKRITLQQKSDVSEFTSALGFSQVIIPTQGVTEIPAYELTYFDPDSAQYITARTEPIPLQVEASSVMEQAAPSTPTASSNSDEVATESPKASPPKPELNSIVEIPLDSLPRELNVISLQPLMRVGFYMVLAAIGVLSVLALASVVKVLFPRSEGVKELRRLRRSTSSPEVFYQALLNYLPHHTDSSVDLEAMREEAYAYLFCSPHERASKEVDFKSKRDAILKRLKY